MWIGKPLCHFILQKQQQALNPVSLWQQLFQELCCNVVRQVCDNPHTPRFIITAVKLLCTSYELVEIQPENITLDDLESGGVHKVTLQLLSKSVVFFHRQNRCTRLQLMQ